MRVDVEPRSATVVPGQPTIITVRVVNTGTVISGHRVRALGVDPRWARLDQPQLSLFPDAAGVAVLSITLPPGIPAGVRRLGIEVDELTPPNDRVVVEVDLTVPAQLGLKVALDPVSVTGGRSAAIGVLVDNTGNSALDIALTGADEEGQVRFGFRPEGATLGPGERALATAIVRAKRPILGSPKIRTFNIQVGPAQPPVSAFGTWVQKPLLSRGAVALVGLVAVISIFAVILTLSLSKVVGQSNADRDLALQVAQAGQTGSGGGGSGSIGGTVTLLTSGAAVSGVTVEIFNASNTASPLASVATSAAGTYQFQGLAAGTYKVRFSGAGFIQLWYPNSLTADNATPVTLNAGQPVTNINVLLGGVPATLAGKVVGADPTGATVSLEVPAPGTVTAGAGSAPVSGASGGASSTSGTGGTSGGTGASATSGSKPPAVVTTQTLDASGMFSLAQIPSPSIYDLVVAKKGFATVTQEVDLGSGEQRSGLQITLVQGNGSIAGQVNSPTGPVGGATISASDGHNTVSTVSFTQGTVGAFQLSNLPTPDTLTLTIGAAGFATQTLTVTLAQAQQVTGVEVNLVLGSGSISGQAMLSSGGAATGVTVTVTNGQLSLQTVTLSTGTPGSYQVSGLPVPSTYTVTFSRPDLVSQTKAVTLNALGQAAATGVNATLTSSSATLKGTVSAINATMCMSLAVTTDTTLPSQTTTTTGNTPVPVGQITVTLSSGSTSYQVTTASSGMVGAYEFDNVKSGTYTVSFTRPGGTPVSSIVTLTAGDVKTLPETLSPAASICGFVYQAGTNPPGMNGLTVVPGPPAANVEVQLFQATQFPSGQSLVTFTNSAGFFEFDNVVAPQTYVVEFSFPQGSAGQFTVEASAAQGQPKMICPSAGAALNHCLIVTNQVPGGA